MLALPFATYSAFALAAGLGCNLAAAYYRRPPPPPAILAAAACLSFPVSSLLRSRPIFLTLGNETDFPMGPFLQRPNDPSLSCFMTDEGFWFCGRDRLLFESVNAEDSY